MLQALVNDTLVNDTKACVSASDRGFRFGDGVFETILVHDGMPYLWEYHMERLAGGLEALRIEYVKDLLLPALRLLKANQVTNGMLRIQVSRGLGSQGYLPAFNPQPTVILQTLERPAPAAPPVTLWLSAYEKISLKALPVNFKLAQGVNSTLARMEAKEQECHDALQLDAQGFVSEASSANIFWLKKDTLFTPSLACGALAGTTRRRIMELSPYKVEEGQYTLKHLKAAEAVILTNSASGATAVSRLLPQAMGWNSAQLADAINSLRNKDIWEYTGRMRESLASK